MTKKVTKKISYVLVNAKYAFIKDGELQTYDLEPTIFDNTRISDNQVIKYYKDIVGNDKTIIIVSKEIKYNTYEMPLDEFLKHSKLISE